MTVWNTIPVMALHVNRDNFTALQTQLFQTSLKKKPFLSGTLFFGQIKLFYSILNGEDFFFFFSVRQPEMLHKYLFIRSENSETWLERWNDYFPIVTPNTSAHHDNTFLLSHFLSNLLWEEDLACFGMVKLSGLPFDVRVKERERESEMEREGEWVSKDRIEWVSVLGDQSFFGSPALSLWSISPGLPAALTQASARDSWQLSAWDKEVGWGV